MSLDYFSFPKRLAACKNPYKDGMQVLSPMKMLVDIASLNDCQRAFPTP
jgi:hypothetical protein